MKPFKRKSKKIFYENEDDFRKGYYVRKLEEVEIEECGHCRGKCIMDVTDYKSLRLEEDK